MKRDSHIKEELKIVSRKENEEILGEDAADLRLQNEPNGDSLLAENSQNGNKADADLDSGQILHPDQEGIED